MTLFRKAALDAQRSKYYGEILLTEPLGTRFYTAASVLTAALVLSLLYFGTYTQKQRVSGRLVPDTGLIDAVAPQSGTVAQVAVKEGQHVSEGDLLFVVRTPRVTGSGENAVDTIRQGLALQSSNLEAEAVRQKQINEERLMGARRRLESSRSELVQVDKNIAVVDSQLGLLRETLKSYEELAERGLFPRIRAEEKRLELLQLESSRRALERERVVTEKQIRLADEEIATETLGGQNQISLIERNRKSAEQALLEHEARSEVRVLAPASGTVSVLLARPGQLVTSRPLLSIVPDGARMQAEIYAPTHSISFVKLGGEVWLRYLAYPYQKFGQHKAKVESVSASALPLSWLSSVEGAENAQSPAVYRVLARLEKETLRAYGVDQSLSPGLEFEADILLDERRIYEWLLEPLFSVSGRF